MPGRTTHCCHCTLTTHQYNRASNEEQGPGSESDWILSQTGELVHAAAADHVSRPGEREGRLDSQRTGRPWVLVPLPHFQTFRRIGSWLLDAMPRMTKQAVEQFVHYAQSELDICLLSLQCICGRLHGYSSAQSGCRFSREESRDLTNPTVNPTLQTAAAFFLPFRGYHGTAVHKVHTYTTKHSSRSGAGFSESASFVALTPNATIICRILEPNVQFW